MYAGILFRIALILYARVSVAVDTKLIDDTTEATCTATQYYSPTSLACKACDSGTLNKMPDTGSVDVNGNFITCECDLGFRRTDDDCSTNSDGNCEGFTCTSCISGGQSAYSDRSACVTCGASTSGLITDTSDSYYGDCGCPTSAPLLVETTVSGEKLSEKECSTCPTGSAVLRVSQTVAGKAYTASLYTCQSCPDAHMSMSVNGAQVATCDCDASYSKVGQVNIGEQMCLKTSLASTYIASENQAAVIEYDSQTLTSLTVLHYYAYAATNCRYYSNNNNACQLLAHLCALHLYNDAALPCSTFNTILGLRGGNIVNNIENWGLGMPWLYYNNAPCFDKSITTTVTFNKQHFEYIVLQYSMNGTYLGRHDLSTLFSYCSRAAPRTEKGGGTSTSTQWQIFGSTEVISRSCDPSLLLENEQYFYDLYLVDASSDLYPVPVRVQDMTYDERTVNKATDELCLSSDVLVRRFFLYDIVGGIVDSTNVPAVMRYASEIFLTVSITTDDPESIYSPILTIKYKELTASETSSTTTTTFHAYYTMDTADFEGILGGFFIAGIIIAILYFLNSYYNYYLRTTRYTPGMAANPNTSNTITIAGILNIANLAAHAFVYIFFIIMLLTTEYWFVFFKLQDTVALLLPPQLDIYNSESFYNSFVLVLHLLFFFQLFYVVNMIMKQAYSDIFFIDWEPPKTKNHEGVSVWRTILVANEYNELLSKRKTSIGFSLLWILFFLYGLNLEYNATQQPDLDNTDRGKLNIVLRFANVTWWWFVVSIAQLLWRYAIYERYISEPPEQVFIDVCTIAKVSVLVLDEDYHGYYLHCRSPHQYADGSMSELVSMLHKEEAGLTIDRSLSGGPKDVQCFELFLTSEWRQKYNKVYATMTRQPTIGEVLQSGRVNRANSLFGGQVTPPDRMLRAWKELQVFLQTFVENNFGQIDLKRVIVEPTYLARLLSTPPDLTIPGQPSVFYPDPSNTFTRMLFLGRELDLLLLNVLSYCIFDLWFNNSAVSAILTYLLDALMCILRDEIGKTLLFLQPPIHNTPLNILSEHTATTSTA